MTLYLKKLKLTSMIFIVQFCKQVYIINKYFNNLFLTTQIYLIYSILDKKNTSVYFNKGYL